MKPPVQKSLIEEVCPGEKHTTDCGPILVKGWSTHPAGCQEKPISQAGASDRGVCALLPWGASALGVRFQQHRPQPDPRASGRYSL